MKKIILGCLAFLLITSCSGERYKRLSVSLETDSNQPIVIHVLGHSSESEYSSRLYNLSEYKPLYGNTTIQIHPYNSESLVSKIQTDFAIGESTDIFAVWPGMLIQKLIDRHLIMDLSPYLEKDSDWRESFRYKELWDPISRGSRIYGLPVEAVTEQMIINSELFEKYGIAYPHTINELIDACHKFRANGISPMDISSWPDLSFLYQGLISSYSTPETLLQPESPSPQNPYIKALYGLKLIYEAGGFSLDDMERLDTVNTGSTLISGNAAMMFNGSWSLSTIHKALGNNIKLLPFPITNTGSTPSIIMGHGSTTFYVSENPRRTPAELNEILHLVKHLTSSKTISTAFADSYFLSNVPLQNKMELSDIFPEILNSGYRITSPPDHMFDRNIWREKILYKMPKILTGVETPERLWSLVFQEGSTP